MSFVIEKGEFVFIVGASGSGKSTMIRLLLKEVEPTSGRIIVGGRDLGRLKGSKVPLLRRNLGCVFQDFKLLPNRTAAENIGYALRVQGAPNAMIRKKVPEVMNLVGLAHKMNARPEELSGGEQQRVSIARAMVNHPPLLICDEPTGNLDPDTSVGIMQLLYRINRTGTTILMVTHDREMVDKMRKRVIALEMGKLVRDERRGGYTEESPTLVCDSRSRGKPCFPRVPLLLEIVGNRGVPHTPMTHVRTLFAEALRSIGANVSTTVASALSVLIGMFLIGVFIGLGTWLVSWSDAKKRELAVHVFIADTATKKEINGLRIHLESDKRVKPGGITFITKERALEIMRKQNPELTANLASNPLPASFDVVPARGEDTEAIALRVQALKLPAVDQVRYGKEVSQRILKIARGIQVVFGIIVIILLAASTILIANTIRLSIFARRREIEVMKLVGATNWYVRGPFMLEGLLTGLAGSVAAVLLLFVGREIAVPQILGHIQDDPDVQAMAFTWTAAILIMGGLAIGAVGSGLTLRRFLRI